MTELIDGNLLLSYYNKFVAIRDKMAVANKKHRETENGKEKTKILRNKWIDTHKNDDIYRIKINLESKLRYHRQIDNDAYRKKLNLQAKARRDHRKEEQKLEFESKQISLADSWII